MRNVTYTPIASATATAALHMLICMTALVLSPQTAGAFMTAQPRASPSPTISLTPPGNNLYSATTAWKKSRDRGANTNSNTALNVWWFGGSEHEEDDESCELVAVRIEKTSANSRRIAGDIIIPKPPSDVWAILTDYDNLSIHVPNLVASKRVNPGMDSGGSPGDGNYQCRLFQRGAQKIVGFEFGASVTMDMTETVRSHSLGEEKIITFKCVESQFFSEFDGEWKLTETVDPDDPSSTVSRVEYVVDVRPRGPVPVQALEWRIREDVPTNLRAVKAASIDVGAEGVLALRESQRSGRDGSANYSAVTNVPSVSSSGNGRRLANVANSTRRNAGNLMNRAATASKNAVANATAPRLQPKLSAVRVDWYEDETMAAYLDNRK